jgi:hypothetical protein
MAGGLLTSEREHKQMWQQPDTEPHGNITLDSGLICPWCNCQISNDPHETADGWEIVCNGCRREILICETQSS